MLIEGVWLRDNGIRSFIPPCFSWDLVDANGVVVLVVSKLSLEFATDNPSVALNDIIRNQLVTKGSTVPYMVDASGDQVEGVAYTIAEFEPKKAKSRKGDRL